jgi:hypothetical protein
MKRGCVALVSVVALVLLGAELPPVEVPKDRRVFAYFTEWGIYGRKYHVPETNPLRNKMPSLVNDVSG